MTAQSLQPMGEAMSPFWRVLTLFAISASQLGEPAGAFARAVGAKARCYF